MLKHTITSKDVRVIATGSVFSFKNQPLTISLTNNDITFEFAKDAEKGQSAQIVPEDERTLKVIIDENSESGTLEPVALGENEKSILYMMFRVDYSRPPARLIHYTFFAKPKKKVVKDAGSKQK